MRITKCLLVLLLAVCLSYPAVAAKAKEASNTYQARCMVEVEANYKVYPVHKSTFNGLLHSFRVKGKADRDVLKSKVIKGVNLKGLLLLGHRNTSMFNLEVRLPENNPDIEPLAEEYLAAVIANMKEVLNEIYRKERSLLDEPFADAQHELDVAKFEYQQLTDVTPVSKAIEKQLDMIVDVSRLNEVTEIGQAVGILSKSIEPALPLAVMWKDIYENVSIEKDEPIGIDGRNMTAVRLGTALDLVLKSVSINKAELGYAIEGGILIIATKEQLPVPVSVDPYPGDLPHMLMNTKGRLMDRKAQAELEIAEYEAYSLAITKQIAKISKNMQLKVKTDEISKQLSEIVHIRTESYSYLTQIVVARGEASKADVNKAEVELAKAKIDYAKRREEISNQAGGDKISELNDQLAETEIDVSVNKSKFAVTAKQLNEVNSQLVAISKYKSKLDKIDFARKVLAVAQDKLTKIEKQLENIKPPVVTVIGAN